MVIYLDDIIIYSKNKNKHVSHIKKILAALIKENLKIDVEKSKFYKLKVDFLEYIIKINDIKMDKKKI